MTSHASLIADLQRAAELLDRAITYIEHPQRFTLLCQPSPPREKDRDPHAPPASAWCWTHECGAALCYIERHNDATCSVSDVSDLTHKDTTGEAALRGLGSNHKRSTMEAYIKGVVKNVHNLEGFIVSNQPEKLTEAEVRKQEQLEAANQQGCDSCARSKDDDGEPRHIPPRSGPTDIGGILAFKRLLCPDCISRAKWRHAQGLTPMPPQAEVEHFHLHRGRWPSAHTAPSLTGMH